MGRLAMTCEGLGRLAVHNLHVHPPAPASPIIIFIEFGYFRIRNRKGWTASLPNASQVIANVCLHYFYSFWQYSTKEIEEKGGRKGEGRECAGHPPMSWRRAPANAATHVENQGPQAVDGLGSY